MKQQNTKTKAKNKDPWETMGRRVIRIADIREPSDSGKTAEQLQAEIKQASTATVEGPARRTVERRNIYVAEKVFQWRGSPEKDQWDRRNHIHTLAKAIKEHGRPLARLLVLP